MSRSIKVNGHDERKKGEKNPFFGQYWHPHKKKNSPFTIIIRKEAEKKEAEPKEEP